MVLTNMVNGPMYIFILAAVSRGRLDTLYALQQEAGLQPGGVMPVIRRLEEEGLLTRLEEGKRRRRMMKLTEKGEEFLGTEWTTGLDVKREVESILRNATVALLMGDPGLARAFLEDAARVRELRVGHSKPTVSTAEAAPIEFLAEMREVSESRRRTMEAALLREFATLLEEAEKNRNEE